MLLNWKYHFYARMVLILSLPADTICQKPLFTLSWMSARTIKLFVVPAREKRVPCDTTFATRVLFLYEKWERSSSPAASPFFSFARKCVQTETAGLKSLSLFLSFCIIFEAATVNESATFLLHEHRFYLGSGASHKWNTTIKCIKNICICVDTNKNIPYARARMQLTFIQSIDKYAYYSILI